MCTAASSPAWSTLRISASRARGAPRPGRPGTGFPWAGASAMVAFLAHGEGRQDDEAEGDDGVVAGHGDAEHAPGRLVALGLVELGPVHEGRQLAGLDRAAAGAGGRPRPPRPLQ